MIEAYRVAWLARYRTVILSGKFAERRT